MRRNKQSARSLVAFLVTWAFLILTVTGIVLYVVPQGRIAYWTHWSLFGLDKDQWGWLHMLFGGLFIATGVLHLYFNWKPFKAYFADRVQGHLAMKREVLIASVLTFGLAVAAVNNLPPASWVIDLNHWVKRAWIATPQQEPPFGHAEELTLAGLAKKQGFDVDTALQALRTAGLQVPDATASLERIARLNGSTPMAVYAHLPQPARPVGANVGAGRPWTLNTVEQQFAGSGIGRKTLAELSEQIGVPIAQTLQRLHAAGIQAEADQTTREVASQYDLSPIDLVKRVLVTDDD